MWALYMLAKTTGQRPSDILPVDDIVVDSADWFAYQFDRAVLLVGTVIENAAQELVESGMGKDKKMVPKYHMDQLLDPDFHLPRPPSRKQRERQNLDSWARMLGAKRIKAG